MESPNHVRTKERFRVVFVAPRFQKDYYVCNELLNTLNYWHYSTTTLFLCFNNWTRTAIGFMFVSCFLASTRFVCVALKFPLHSVCILIWTLFVNIWVLLANIFVNIFVWAVVLIDLILISALERLLKIINSAIHNLALRFREKIS